MFERKSLRVAEERMQKLLRPLAEREVIGYSESDGLVGSSVNLTYDPSRLALWTEFHERVACRIRATRVPTFSTTITRP